MNHGPASYVLGGWQVGAILRYQDGQPMAFCCTQEVSGVVPPMASKAYIVKFKPPALGVVQTVIASTVEFTMNT